MTSHPVADDPPMEEQIRQLKEAGWGPQTGTIWRSPLGALYLGPHGAWKHMKREVLRARLRRALPRP